MFMWSISINNSLNILLDQNGYKAKLGDFGFALDMPQSQPGKTLVTAPLVARTSGYMPPEIQGSKFSPKSDMYSYGIVSCSLSMCENEWII